MADYIIDFTLSTPYDRKYAYVKLSEKFREIAKNPVKLFEIILPNIINIIGVLFFNWNFLQILCVYFIDVVIAHFSVIVKIMLNDNLESLRGVYIKNTFNKSGRKKYTGTLDGLKIRATLFYTWFLFIIILVLPCFALISFLSFMENTSLLGLVIAGFSITVGYIIDIVLFRIRNEHKVTVIGEYYNKVDFKLGTITCFILICYIGFFFGLILLAHLNLFLTGVFLIVLFAAISIPQAVAREYFFLKKVESPGVKILKLLRSNKIQFSFLQPNTVTDKKIVLEAKLVKKPTAFSGGEFEYFLIIQDSISPFGSDLLTKISSKKDLSYCTTEETEEITGYKQSIVPPFSRILQLQSFVLEDLMKNEKLIIDLKMAGQIEISSKDYFKLESPNLFKK
jgi:hypothetical protein